MPKVSIIITVYNTAKYMKECMDSVLAQTLTDIEIILVDDGSTDGVSPALCDDYAKIDSRVVVIHKENGGLMSAWIEGTKRATAAYVSYLDSDDWVDTDMMELLYRETSQFLSEQESGKKQSSNLSVELSEDISNHEIISGNYIVEKAGERRRETQSLNPGVYTGKELDVVREKLLGCEVRPVTMSRCMKLISKKLILDNIKYCNPKIKMGEDVNITLPCLCDCKRLVIMKGSYFYHYRLVAESMAHGYDPKLLSNLDLTDVTFRGILKDKGISNADEQLNREYIMILFLVLKNELRCREGGTVKRIRDIFLRKDIKEKIDCTKVNVSSKANRLLYFCMKHPNPVAVSFTKAVIRAFDRRTN